MSIIPDLTGRVCLVTGASRGIGKAIVLGLAEAGADVAVNYRSQAEEAQTVADAIAAMGRKTATVQADVSQGAEVSRMVAETESVLGSIDILVNNAGTARRRSVEELSEKEFDETIAVNLKSVFLCTQAVLPNMRAQKWGRIVNISSGAARGTGAIGIHYNASKGGTEAMTRGYAARLANDGITVNAVAPSLIATDDMPLARVDAGANIPVGRLGSGEEVAQAVLMVIANAYMTGATIQLNGGLHFI